MTPNEVKPVVLTEEELPPLPAMTHTIPRLNGYLPVYTAEQMREYARSAVLERAGAVPQVWVSVEERLPEAMETVLYEDKEGYLRSGFFNGTVWWGCGSRIEAPSHWHPAPAEGPERARIVAELEAAWAESQAYCAAQAASPTPPKVGGN